MTKATTCRREAFNEKKPIAAVVLSAALLVTPFPVLSWAQSEPQKLVGTGEPAPPAEYFFSVNTVNNNGVDVQSLLLGGKVVTRSKLVGLLTTDHQLNSANDVAFTVTDESGLLKGAIDLSRSAPTRTLRKIVAIGDETPDGEVLTRILGFSMNESGDILFAAETSGPSPSSGLPDCGLFLARGTAISRVIAAGDATPIGTLVELSSPQLADNGQIYFTGKALGADGTLTQAILRVSNPDVEVIVKQGDRSETGDEIVAPDVQAVSNSGAVAFLDNSGGKAVAYLRTGGVVATVAKEGTPIPGSTLVFGGITGFTPFIFSQKAIGPDDAVTLLGAFLLKSGNAALALYRYTKSSGLQELLRTGQPVQNYEVHLLSTSVLDAQGTIYCGAFSFGFVNGAVIKIAQNQRKLTQFPGANGQTVGNKAPYAINRQGDAVFDRLEFFANSAFAKPFPGIPAGQDISLNLFHLANNKAETVVSGLSPSLPGSRFFSFSNLVTTSRGDALFIGNVAGGRNLFRMRNNSIEVIARQGQQIGNLTVRSLTKAVMNDQGVIAFQAETNTGSAIFVLRGATPERLMASGDPAAGDLLVGHVFDVSINQSGQIAFIANLANPDGSNRTQALFLATATSSGYTMSIVTDLSSLPRIKSTQAQFMIDLSLGDNGTIVFTARAMQAEAVFKATPRPRGAGFDVEKKAESGGATPMGGTFSQATELQPPGGAFQPEVFISPQITPQGTISFMAKVTMSDNRSTIGIFSLRPGGSLEKVVASGDWTSSGPLSLLPVGHSANAEGDIAFLNLEQNEPALYLCKQGVIERLVSSRHPLTDGGVLTPLWPVFASSGRIIFLGSLINRESRLAIFSMDTSGGQ